MMNVFISFSQKKKKDDPGLQSIKIFKSRIFTKKKNLKKGIQIPVQFRQNN